MSEASTSRTGPKPWFGCDTASPAWRAYCEAWVHAFSRNLDPRLRGMIHDSRGAAALAALDHDIEVVKKDYRGEIDDRTALPGLLRG